MQSDEPAYLSVGTEISAKFKGAFCEAKVKKIVKHVKCKVTHKDPPFNTVTVDDCQIRSGNLVLGVTVEIGEKNSKTTVKAVVQNVKDCSTYTVVFNDGDERILRRTMLCPKGARHFDSTVSLDSMPLTNPELFGSPVPPGPPSSDKKQTKKDNKVAKKTDNSDTEETDSTEEKVTFSRSDIGKVVCVYEDGIISQKEANIFKKIRWIPAMIVSPKCQKNMKLQSDGDILIKSFKDGKYVIVNNSQMEEFLIEKARKIDQNQAKPGIDKAIHFVEKSELPPHWDRQSLLQDNTTSSSENDDSDDDDDDAKKDKKSQKGSTDDQSDSDSDFSAEERDRFVAQLYKFQDERGTPINKAPVLGGQDLNLYKLYRVVQKLGGFNRVCNNSAWKQVLTKMKLEGCPGATAFTVRNSYVRYLSHFDTFYRQLSWRMDESWSGASRTSRSVRMADKAKQLSFQNRKRSVDKSSSSESVPKLIDSVTSKLPSTQTESNESTEKKSNEPQKVNAKIRSSTPSDSGKSPRPDANEEPLTGCSSSGKYFVGQKVCALHGSGSQRRWYDARILQIEINTNKSGQSTAKRCFIHYFGWKSRYDEWVTPGKIKIITDANTTGADNVQTEEQPKETTKNSQELSTQSDTSSTCSEKTDIRRNARNSVTPQSTDPVDRQSPALRKLAMARKKEMERSVKHKRRGRSSSTERRSSVKTRSNRRSKSTSSDQTDTDSDEKKETNESLKTTRKRTISATIIGSGSPISQKAKRSKVVNQKSAKSSDESDEASSDCDKKAPLTRAARRKAKTKLIDDKIIVTKVVHSTLIESERPHSAPNTFKTEKEIYDLRKTATPNDRLIEDEKSIDDERELADIKEESMKDESIELWTPEKGAQTPAYGDDEGDGIEHDIRSPQSGSNSKTTRRYKTKRRRRNYSQMITERRSINRTPRKDDDDSDSDGPIRKESTGSPKDSLASLKARIQQQMEEENDWDVHQFNFTPIEPTLQGDAKIAALQQRMQQIREAYQQVRLDLAALERKWKRTLQKRKKRRQEEKTSKKEADVIKMLACTGESEICQN